MSELFDLLDRAARGNFPPADFSTKHFPSPSSNADCVLAFFGHHVIASDVDPQFVLSWTCKDPFALSDVRFLTALANELQVAPGILDSVYAALGLGAEPTDCGLVKTDDRLHSRVVRAMKFRDQASLRVFHPIDGGGTLVLGRGLAGRLEAAYEVDEGQRGRGIGRHLLASARKITPKTEPVFVSISPGNVASMRALHSDAAAWRPVGSEVLFLRSGIPSDFPH